MPFGNFELSFTASAGVAAYPDNGKVPDELTLAADMALYAAKNEGRNRVVVAPVSRGRGASVAAAPTTATSSIAAARVS